MNHYLDFILSRQYGHSLEKKPPRPDPHCMAERIIAGEEIDRNTIHEHLSNFHPQWFRDVLKIVVFRTEVVPPGVIHCLIEASSTWLSDPIVQRQIQVWQMKARGDHKNRALFKRALRGIGTALDPTTGKGNPQLLGGPILCAYEDLLERFKTLRREVRADLKEARRKRLSTDPRIRAAALAREDKYKDLFGDNAMTFIEAVINRDRLDLYGIIGRASRQSSETVRKTIQRERAKNSSRGKMKKKRSSAKKIEPSL